MTVFQSIEQFNTVGSLNYEFNKLRRKKPVGSMPPGMQSLIDEVESLFEQVEERLNELIAQDIDFLPISNFEFDVLVTHDFIESYLTKTINMGLVKSAGTGKFSFLGRELRVCNFTYNPYQ